MDGWMDGLVIEIDDRQILRDRIMPLPQDWLSLAVHPVGYWSR
jgi:hypothetical protein